MGKTRTPSRRIIIIGAGASGISAAYELSKAGHEVLVLEASATIGGRIRSLEGFANFPIELGAEEVHGMNNSLVALSSPKLIRHRLSNDYIRHSGKLLRMTAAARIAPFRRVLDFVASSGDFSESRLSVEQEAVRNGLSRQFWHYLESRMGVEHGTTLDRLGMSGFSGYDRSWVCRSRNYTAAAPYVTLLRPLLDPVAPAVRLRSPVVRVVWGAGGASVSIDSGETIEAAAVVYTGSVAVLRESPPEFCPPLPAEKMSSLSGIGMDGGMKVILKFRRKFWPASMYFLHSDLFFPQFWAPGARRPAADPVLTAFVGRSRAERVISMGVSPPEFAILELDRIFGHRAASRNLESCHVEDWTAHPFIRGLYSFPAPGANPSARAMLSAPLSGSLFFAGEATDTSGNSATVHGAIDSGRRVALQVLSALMVPSPSRRKKRD